MSDAHASKTLICTPQIRFVELARGDSSLRSLLEESATCRARITRSMLLSHSVVNALRKSSKQSDVTLALMRDSRS